MSITILSFLSAIIWSSLFVLITYFIRKINGMKKYYGTPLLLFLYVFGIFRILFPLEFSFTKVITNEKTYAFFYEILYLNKFGNISVFFIIFIFFVVVAFYKIVKFIISYHRTKAEVLKDSIPSSNRENNVLNEIKLKSNKNLNIKILKNNYLNTPIGIGIFKKAIILPNKDYTDSELNFILLHEYTHFLNNDIFVKIMTSVFCDIFWWNFIVQLLKKDLEQLLEIKCDLKVVQNINSEEKADYLSIILKTLKDTEADEKTRVIGTTLVNSQEDKYIKERFMTVMKYNVNDNLKLAKSLALISTLFVTILSYSFIIQPAYEAPDGEGFIRKENSYILKTSDGKYFLFTDNMLESELSEDSVKIFNEMGISIKEE